MTTRLCCFTLVLWLACCALRLSADEAPAPTASPAASEAAADNSGEKVVLRYSFQPGEIIRSKIEHLASIRSTVAGTTQTAETISRSVKAWRVQEVTENSITFVHMVESVDMSQKLSGRQEVTYNSQTDEQVPLGFQDAAKSVGVPLTVVTIDARGEVLHREEKVTRPNASASQITVVLPEEPVAIGDVWTVPYDLSASGRDGRVVQIKARQRMELEKVSNGVATIRFTTQILTPMNDPVIEAQVIQGQSAGHVRFDIARGRVISQRSDLDKRVHGFQGEASSLHYVTRFTEELLPAEEAVAAAPVAGPQPAKPPVLKNPEPATETTTTEPMPQEPAAAVASQPQPAAKLAPMPKAKGTGEPTNPIATSQVSAEDIAPTDGAVAEKLSTTEPTKPAKTSEEPQPQKRGKQPKVRRE